MEFIPEDTDQIFQLSQETDVKKWLPDQVYKTKKEAAEILEFLIV